MTELASSHPRAGKLMFSHTQNDNGTYNTRCLYCFMTIASSLVSIRDVELIETQHICPERALAELLAQHRLVTGDLPSRVH